MNTRGFSKLAVALSLLSGAVALGPSGCKPSVAALCNKVCDCTGCSDSERDDCVDDIDDARKAAEDEGCGEQFDAYTSCASGELTCEDDKVQVDGCDAESEAILECMDAAIPVIGKDRCQAALDRLLAKFEECGIEVQTDPSEQPACNPEDAYLLECYVPCYEAATCSALDGSGSTDDLSNCLTDCF
jgi:hypothetical protein